MGTTQFFKKMPPGTKIINNLYLLLMLSAGAKFSADVSRRKRGANSLKYLDASLAFQMHLPF
jgi:hypothetical protein